ncbi:hypothetical protein J1N35_030741 [Gossypium stocksii]|uniref:Glucosyltransferase 24 catalytic domain-containing protein n=1 Tax=Gossypium stocksii TaxID=47602 RepID=A0A9D3ZV10_9ROSI|nr:hypothetical protein J1N35_030741 [Gossypium stocksii]
METVCSFSPNTRIPFIRATMPVYLYPFLNTMSNERSYVCLRVTSLGVIGSLAKDLPNYAQHRIPIFSLPQEWLWCESWCGNATKPKAKTIDLCNNPTTKEPKLQGARRIVHEWTDLDFEARKFTAKILGDEMDNPEALASSEKSVNDGSSEDLESKAEL